MALGSRRGNAPSLQAMDHEEILALYDARRAASRPVANELIRRIGRDAMEDAARRLGLLVRGTLVFDSESEAAVLSDLCIFDQWTNGENIVERMLRTDPPEAGTVAREMLEAKRTARFSIFAYERTVAGVGVYVRDLFRPEVETFVVDRGMSISDVPIAMAMRLMFLPEFAMTTGAGIPITSGEAMADVLERLQRRFGTQGAQEMATLPRQEQSELAFITAKALLARGQARHIAYEDRPDLAGPRALGPEAYEPRLMAQEPVRVAPKVGRNEPCPCGSGKKFKKCHG